MKEEGCITYNAFQIGPMDYSILFSVYGIPHGKDKEIVEGANGCNPKKLLGKG